MYRIRFSILLETDVLDTFRIVLLKTFLFFYTTSGPSDNINPAFHQIEYQTRERAVYFRVFKQKKKKNIFRIALTKTIADKDIIVILYTSKYKIMHLAREKKKMKRTFEYLHRTHTT